MSQIELPYGSTPAGQDLAVFAYAGTDVRAVLRDGEPWFVAKDVCSILAIANPLGRGPLA